MTKILPFSVSEQAEIRRLLRQADPAHDLTDADQTRMERLILASLDRPLPQPFAMRVWRMIFGETHPFQWSATAMGAIAAGVLLGSLVLPPTTPALHSNLIAVAAADPWQQYSDDFEGDTQ